MLQNYFWTPREQHRFNVPFDYCSLIDVEFCRDLKISQNRVYNLNIEMSADRSVKPVGEPDAGDRHVRFNRYGIH